MTPASALLIKEVGVLSILIFKMGSSGQGDIDNGCKYCMVKIKLVILNSVSIFKTKMQMDICVFVRHLGLFNLDFYTGYKIVNRLEVVKTKVTRWAWRFSKEATKIMQISGKEYRAADALSSNPVPSNVSGEAEFVIATLEASATFLDMQKGQGTSTLPDMQKGQVFSTTLPDMEKDQKKEVWSKIRKEQTTCQTKATSDSGYLLKGARRV